MESFRTYLNRDEKPLIIFDGGTGTSFQNLNLTADEFGGKELEGTAAKITPVKKIESSELNGERPIMNKLKSKLIEITEGRSEDYDNWVTRISLK